MANFDTDNKLIWTEISQGEARAFVSFLKLEVIRHEKEGVTCQFRVDLLKGLSRELWESAYLRHVQDITECNELISKVKEYFRL